MAVRIESFGAPHSVVDLRRGVLVTNLELAGKPTDMLLKPDGGELYVISPEAHGLQAINTGLTRSAITWSGIGAHSRRPERGRYAPICFRTPLPAASRLSIFQSPHRRDPGKGFPVPAGDSPAALRFDPAENLLWSLAKVRRPRRHPRAHEFLLTLIPSAIIPESRVKLF